MEIAFYLGGLYLDATSNNYGGVESSTLSLSKFLSLSGHNVDVIGENVSELKYERFNVLNVNIVREYKEYDIVIYVNTTKKTNNPALKSKKNLLWVHNNFNEDFTFDGINKDNINNVLNFYDKVLFVSYTLLKVFTNFFKKNKDKLDVLYNVVDIDLLHLPIPFIEREDLCLYTSSPNRGLQKLINDWPSFKKKNPSYKLLICGPSYSYTHKQNDPDLDIYYLGSLDKDSLYKVMSRVKYWMYPGDYPETFCISALEALYHNCIPVIKQGSYGSSIYEILGDFYTDYDTFINSEITPDFKPYNFDKSENYIVKKYNPFKTSNKLTKIYRDMSNNLEVDATFIISMDNSESKMMEIKKEVDKLPPYLKNKVFNVKAIDGNNIPENLNYNLYPNWKIPDHLNDWYSRNMTKGEVGCALSHYKIWELSKKRGYSKILILEEDFKVSDFEIPLGAVPSDNDYDIFYLGCQERGNSVSFNEYVSKVDYGWLAHAYILTDNAIEELLRNDYINRLIPVDDYLPLMYTKSDIRSDYTQYYSDINSSLNAYSLKKSFITQSSDKNTSQTLNTDEVNVYNTPEESLVEKKEGLQNWSSYVLYDYTKHLNPAFKNHEYDLIIDEPIDSVFHLNAFSKEYCSNVKAMAEYKNKWTEGRHDHYPTYDVLLNDLDPVFNEKYTDFLNTYVRNLCIHKFSLEGRKWGLFQCENFIIKYTPDRQGHLSLHHDASDLSCVLSLNENYEGGGTWFSRQNYLVKGSTGDLTIHPGQITHRHGARPVNLGVRYVLVSFMRASG